MDNKNLVLEVVYHVNFIAPSKTWITLWECKNIENTSGLIKNGKFTNALKHREYIGVLKHSINKAIMHSMHLMFSAQHAYKHIYYWLLSFIWLIMSQL